MSSRNLSAGDQPVLYIVSIAKRFPGKSFLARQARGASLIGSGAARKKMQNKHRQKRKSLKRKIIGLNFG